jgi:hypothetical protein
MAVIFRQDEEQRTAAVMQLPDPPPAKRSLFQTTLFFVAMIGFLVFSDWANPSQTIVHKKDGTQVQVAVLMETTETLHVQYEEAIGERKKGEKVVLAKADIERTEQATPENYQWAAWMYNHRWYFAGACLLATLAMIGGWFDRDEVGEWMGATWGFAKSIVPLLFGGVLVTGFVGKLIPDEAVAAWVGGNSFTANMVASVIGAMWYFATLTEIPILEALLGLGMGRGPALALLLAGPALSLPSIAVIYSVIGFKKTAVFVGLVVVLSAIVGMVFGVFYG